MVCGVALIAAIILFIYTPGMGINRPILIGYVTVMLLGEVVIRITEKARHADPSSHSEG